MKTYLYEGDDSINARLIQTDSFNDKGKVQLIISWAQAEEKDIKKYIDVSKEIYTYDDTFVTEILTISKNTIKNSELFTYGSYEEGDSQRNVFHYKLDNKNRIIQRKSLRSGKNEFTEGKWSVPGEWIEENIYDDRYGLIKESLSSKHPKDSTFTLLRWSVLSYDHLYTRPKGYEYRLAARDYYSRIAEHMLTHVYKYSQDTVKVYAIPSRRLTDCILEGDTATRLDIPSCEIYIHNKKKELITKINCIRSGYPIKNQYCSYDYYTYDIYGRKIKRMYKTDNYKRTEFYTYE